MLYLLSMQAAHFKRQKGQILISILIALAVFAILIHALFTLIAASFDLVSINRARITAKHLALDRIETIHNLAYEDIGTTEGIPNGILNETEVVNVNGLNFTIKTNVIYVDDEYDGQGADDLFPDYKRVRVEAMWEGLAKPAKNPLVLITDIAPAIAQSYEGAGILEIAVVDAYGIPVPQASVIIIADSLDPAVNLNVNTGNDGKVDFPGAQPCNECYKITVTKEGFSTDRTYSTSEVANPIKPHITIIEGNVTQTTFAIDKIATLNVSSVANREGGFTAQPDVSFRLRGAKILGTDAFAQFVYKYDETHSTDDSGSVSLDNLEWDNYSVFMPEVTSYDISGTSPLLNLNLLPDSSLDFIFSTESHSDHNLLNIVKDPSQNLIENAYINLTSGSYDEEETTGLLDTPDFGQAFFPNLENKTYDYTATASGYLNSGGNINVNGSTQNEIILSPE